MLIDTDICKTFQEIVLAFALIDGVQRVVFNEMKLTENRWFKELWAVDFCPEDSGATRILPG
jgi:hypothetical protein